MKYITIAATALALSTGAASAASITLADFDGSESIIDFNSATIGSLTGVFSESGVTLSTTNNQYTIQAAGSLLGGDGNAYSTRGPTNGPTDENNVLISFDNEISRFGANFGNLLGNIISATVSGFDASNALVESATFTDFENTFVGFDFASGVSSVRIERTGGIPQLFTFVENLRFVEQTTPPPSAVPLPAGFPLLAAGLIGLGALARRKKSV